MRLVAEIVWEANQQLELTFVSSRCSELLGYQPAEIIGRSLRTLGSFENPGAKAASITTDRPFYDVQFIMSHKDGSKRHVLLSGLPLFDPATGDLLGLRGTARDVTGDRLATERSRLQQEEIAHARRVSMMGEMASGLAHELNQPLTAILSYADAAVQRYDTGRSGERDIGDTLRKIGQQAIRAGQIIQGMRDFVRKELPERHRVDLAATIREVLSLIEIDARSNDVHVLVNLHDHLPDISAVAIQIQQVVLNLARNAIDAMMSIPVADRFLGIEAVLDPAGAVRVRVSDCGRGIPEDQRDHIFQSFASGKPGGMGMGLSISRTIIELHGGRLWLEKSGDAGSVFAFELPASTLPSATEPAEDAPNTSIVC